MADLPFENDSFHDRVDRLNDRGGLVRGLMEKATQEEVAALWNQLDVSAVYHDCALEGQVISPEELAAAFDPRVISDAANMDLYLSLRSHRRAFDLVRSTAQAPTLHYDLKLFKELHFLFTAEGDDPGASVFRKEIPLHRSYFQEIDPPQVIEEHLLELIDWLNTETDTEHSNPLMFASRFHHRFMSIFPFPDTSGKVGRAVLNLILIRNGYLPAVIHATERQRYYEALRQSTSMLTELLVDSVTASFDAAVRFLRRTSAAV